MKVLKYGFRKDGQWYVPQISSAEKDSWMDICKKHLGDVGSEIHKITYRLGEPAGFQPNLYHFTPGKGEKSEDMPLAFISDYKVMAFLGMFKYHMETAGKTVEVKP